MDLGRGLRWNTDDNSRYKSLSHGPAPMVESCVSREDLVTRVQAILADWGAVPAAVDLGVTCIMADSRLARDQLMVATRSAGYIEIRMGVNYTEAVVRRGCPSRR
jgi:hypothetical protein